MANRLPEKFKTRIDFIRNVLGVDDFVVYGGAAIDSLIAGTFVFNDLDIAIIDTNINARDIIVQNVLSKGFKKLGPFREYTILRDIKVPMIYLQKDELILDICFLQNPKKIGLFDVESLYWRAIDMTYVDRHSALKSIKNKQCRLIRNIGDENALLIFSRLIRNASKYDISLQNDKNLILEIKNNIKCDLKLGSEPFQSCTSSIFRSILDAKNRMGFITELAESEIITEILPTMHKAIVNISASNHREILSKAVFKKDLVPILNSFLNGRETKKLMLELKGLSSRTWDQEDQKLSKLIEKNEKNIF